MKRLTGACLIAGSLILAGCSDKSSSDGDSADAFGVSGTLTDNTKSTSASLTHSVQAVSGTTADYAYAVNTAPEFGTTWRKKAAIADDGSFSLELTKGDPWVIAFIDSTKTGADMIETIFKADQLDSIAPKSDTESDSTDLGDMESNSTNSYMATGSYDSLIGDLGMSTAEATALGELDDLMLRNINPDMDGDGNLDMDQADMPELRITYWMHYEYKGAAGDSLLTDIKNGTTLTSSGELSYIDASPQLRIKKESSGIFQAKPAKWSLSWTDSGSYTGGSMAESNGSTSGMMTDFDDSGDISLKVTFPDFTTDLPDGTYTYKLYENLGDTEANKTLTFTHVQTYADANDTENFVFPFPKFVKDTTSGEITSVSYTWMKKTSSGFTEATADEIELIMGKNSGEIKWYSNATKDDAHGAYITLSPHSNDFNATGSVAIADATQGDSFDPALDQVTEVAISFSTKLGMFIKMIIN